MSHLRGAAAALLNPPTVPATAAAVTHNVRDDYEDLASVVSLQDVAPVVAEKLHFLEMSIEG
eukprot:4453168-Prymnesium_polylepis.1